jgi:PadR family transcriptional regulator PadR
MAFRSDLDALILGVLRNEALHGYDIAKRIRDLSNKCLKIGEGQLYPTLHRLEDEGSVQAEWVQQEGKPARKVYSITPEGTVELDKQQKAWQQFAEGVNQVFAGKKLIKEDLCG